MKRNNLGRFDKGKGLVRRQRVQLIDGVKAGDARNQFAMRVIWLILGGACAALGWVLITILLR
jgi:hypothetical protein